MPLLELHAKTLTLRMQTGRRGADVDVSGALTFAPGQAWDDASLVLALLDAEGAVLALERGSLRLEEASGTLLRFTESLRLPQALAERVHAMEGWASAVVIEHQSLGALSVAEDLPPPELGASSFHTVNGASLRRPAPDEAGEVRMTLYGRCAFDGHSTYDARGEVRVDVLDGEGVRFSDSSSFETLNGQHGSVSFDVRLRPHSAQLLGAERMVMSLRTKRFVSSARVTVPRSDFAVFED